MTLKELKKRIFKLLTHLAPLYSYKKFWNRKGTFEYPKRITHQEQSRFPLLGIIEEQRNFHYFYIAACEEMNVPYILIDLTKSNWIDIVKQSGCKGILVWPSASSTVIKNMFDERIKVINEDLGFTIFPSYNEMWVWESKRRMHYWFEANNIKHPQGWIFYDYDEARAFLEHSSFPLVFKTNHGDSSQGVKILRKKAHALKILNKCFGAGVNMGAGFAKDLEWGSIFFQKFIENPIEWRIIRIGDSYFGYQKVRRGDFASGSGDAVFTDIPFHILSYVRDITDNHNLKSISFDVLLDNDNNFYMIEIQSLFGDTKAKRKLVIDGEPGRYKYDYDKENWFFEKGIFDQNNCGNLRVAYLLEIIIKQT